MPIHVDASQKVHAVLESEGTVGLLKARQETEIPRYEERFSVGWWLVRNENVCAKTCNGDDHMSEVPD